MQYEELTPPPSAEQGAADLGRLQNVPVELAVELGRTRMTIGEALALGPGSVVTVGRLAGDPVDLLVNGRTIARGEVVAIDEELGLRITEIAAAVVEPAADPDPGTDPDGDSGGAPGGEPPGGGAGPKTAPQAAAEAIAEPAATGPEPAAVAATPAGNGDFNPGGIE